MARITKADLVEENKRLTKKLDRLQRSNHAVRRRLEFYQGLDEGHRASRSSICGKKCNTCSFLWEMNKRPHCVKLDFYPKGTSAACGDYIPTEC